MGIIVLIGVIYMLINGNIGQCLIFIAIVAISSDKFTDNNRRGGWWK